MTKIIVRLITLLLAIIMTATVATGCNGGTGGSESPSGENNANDGKISGMLPEVKLEDYKGTTVKYASWKNPWQNEDGDAIDTFMAETGINVEWVAINQNDYVNKIVASMVSGDSPDVFFESQTFPGSLRALQPLDAMKLDLSDPFWNQGIIKASTLDGHPYLIDSNSNVWTERAICVYNKKLFEDNGITTPTELYEQGKWTFANFYELAKQISMLGKQYVGATSLIEPLLGAAGCTTFTYKDNKLSYGVDNKMIEVSTFLAQMREAGYLKYDRNCFQDGKTGMAITDCFALKKTGYYPLMNSEDMAATYLPVWKEGEERYSTGVYRGWGLVDGAKNPVAAGIFLRWYLDGGNYDFTKTFHNEEVADFFFEVTADTSEVLYYRDHDLVNTTGLGRYFSAAWAGYSSNSISTQFDSNKNTMLEMCDKANEIIDSEREWIKKAESEGKINKVSK